MDEGDVLTTLKILIIGESGVGKSRCIYTALSYIDWYRQRNLLKRCHDTRTPDISAPSHWCQSVQTVRHQCGSVLRHFGTGAKLSRTSTNIFSYSRPYRKKVLYYLLLFVLGNCFQQVKIHCLLFVMLIISCTHVYCIVVCCCGSQKTDLTLNRVQR